jgi:TFIIF-interacting CTD phosphatase-like protein
LLDGVCRFVRFFVMRLEFVVEQGFELVRIEIAADHEAHAVGDELDHVHVFEDLRIFREHRALGRIGNVVFNGE